MLSSISSAAWTRFSIRRRTPDAARASSVISAASSSSFTDIDERFADPTTATRPRRKTFACNPGAEIHRH